MLTQDQIETFAALVDEEAGYSGYEDSVVGTRDTVRDFIAKWGDPDEVSEGLNVWFKIQAAKGQQRRTLCVYDFGDVRAAVTC